MPVEVAQGILNITPSMANLQSLIDRQMRGVNTRRAGQEAGEGYTSGFGASAKKLTGILSAGFAAVKVGDFAKSAVAQASDLAEAGSKLQVVFGDATDSVNQFAAGGAKALGQSKLAVQNAAAQFGVYGKAAGLAGSANADFSKNLVGLSTDLASFYNTDPAAAAEAISAGLRGESEPLRSYGVLLDDATLRNKALQLGLITTTKDALTPANKVLAAQASIMEQTTIAQGDFARTSGGLANQQRILAAQWTDMKGKLGAAFLPVVTATVTALNDHLFPVLSDLGTKASAAWAILANGDFKGASAGLGEEDSPLVGALFRAHDVSLTMTQTLGQAWALLRTGDFVGGEGNQLGSEDSPLVNALFTAREMFQQIGPTLKEAWSILAHGDFKGGLGFEEDSPFVDFMFKLRDIGLDVFAKIKDIWDQLWSLGEKLWPSIESIGKSFFEAWQTINGSGWSTFGIVFDGIKIAIDALITVLNATLVPALDWLAGFFRDNPAEVYLLVGAFTAWKVAILAQSAATWIAQAATKAWAVATGLLNAVMDANPITLVIVAIAALAAGVIWAYNNVDWFREIVDKAWSWIKDATMSLWENGIKPFFNWVADNIHVVGDFFIAMWNAAQPIFDFLKNSFANFLTVVQGVIDFVVGVFTGDWSRAWDGIKTIFSGIWSQVMNIISTAWDLVTGIGGKILEWLGAFGGWAWEKIVALAGQVVEWGATFLSWLWDGIKNMAVNVWQWFADLPGALWNLIAALVGTIIGYGAQFLSWIWDGIKNTAVSVFQWFSDLPQAIWERVAALVSTITNYGVDFINWIWDGIKNGAVALFQWFTDIPSLIWNAIKDLGATFIGYGKQFIDWIISGIVAGAKAVADAVTGLFDLKLNEEGTGYVTANPLAPGAGGGVVAPTRGRVGIAAGGGVLSAFPEVIPGYAPGVDKVHGLLSPGEGVLVPEAVQMLGADWVYGINRFARGGRQVNASQILGMERFAGGGIVKDAKDLGIEVSDKIAAGVKSGSAGSGLFAKIANDVITATAKAMKGLLTAGGSAYPAAAGTRGAFMKAVASQMGLPYVWGGASPPNFDCSGLMSWALSAAGAGIGRLTAAEFGDRFPRISPEKPGDMAIFDTGRVSPKAGHIGMILDAVAGTMMHTDGAGPSRTSDYRHRSGLMGFIDPIGGEYSPLPGQGASGGLGGILSKVKGVIASKLGANNAVGTSLDGAPPPSTSGGVAMWHNIVLQALGITGQPAAYSSYVEHQMDTESSGRVGAINLTDSNARKGTPSKGLMQVIDPTFRSYALAPYNQNIYDPLSNIIASIRYVLAAYGSIPAGMRGVAYDQGGWLQPSAVNLLNKPEAVLTPPESAAYIQHAQALADGFGGQVLRIELAGDGPITEAALRASKATFDGQLVEMTFAARTMAGQAR